MKNKLWAIIVLLAACSCGKKEQHDPEAVVQLMKETGQLVTAEYTLSKIIKASDDKTWYKVGNRKILMQCEASVKAGVDLQKITAKDVVVTGDSITLQLPRARLFSLQLPPDKIKVQYVDVDLLRDPFTAAEREALLAQAESQIRQTVGSLGVLQTAQDNAALYLQRLLRFAGYTKVGITFSPQLN